MSIKDISNLAIYFSKEEFSPERNTDVPYPMIVIVNSSNEILAAIKFRITNNVWYVKNVVAIKGFGPTIYRLLIERSGCNGLAPNEKLSFESPDLIVEKSKNIWKKFYNEESVEHIYLDKKYYEPHLNYKFVANSIMFDVERGESNLDDVIYSEFKKQRSILDRFLANESIEIEKFKLNYLKNLYKAVKDFLGDSVDIHRE